MKLVRSTWTEQVLIFPSLNQQEGLVFVLSTTVVSFLTSSNSCQRALEGNFKRIIKVFGNVQPLRSLLCLILRGSNKIHQGEIYHDFLREGVFLGHFVIIIKLTWGFFSKICNLTSPTIRHKRVMLLRGERLVGFVKNHYRKMEGERV